MKNKPTPPRFVSAINEKAPQFGAIRYQGREAFGSKLFIDRYELANGLTVLLCEDHGAPVIAYHTWFGVGSRHERPGKTGLAHLFEHLMFNETERHPLGEFDRLLEEAGAESNASTWLDFTQYNVSIPKDQLDLVVELETDRMSRLVLRDKQVESEKEVVMNERRYRVDDDVEGTMSEQLWATAFEKHSYRWPTIGYMSDIIGFSTEDCQAFYRTYYAPNNATLVLAGDFEQSLVLERLSGSYGRLMASDTAREQPKPEPEQTAERKKQLTLPTATEKLTLGYRSPPLKTDDHAGLSLLSEVLFGGRASRMYKRLVRDLEIASEVRAFVGPHHDASLWEIYAGAKNGHTAEEMLDAIDKELSLVVAEPISQTEVERAQARMELSLLCSLDTVDGKAMTIGFYETLLGDPAAAFQKLSLTNRLGPSELQQLAQRYLRSEQRTIIFAQPSLS